MYMQIYLSLSLFVSLSLSLSPPHLAFRGLPDVCELSKSPRHLCARSTRSTPARSSPASLATIPRFMTKEISWEYLVCLCAVYVYLHMLYMYMYMDMSHM